jgi:hypothetical protein
MSAVARQLLAEAAEALRGLSREHQASELAILSGEDLPIRSLGRLLATPDVVLRLQKVAARLGPNERNALVLALEEALGEA